MYIVKQWPFSLSHVSAVTTVHYSTVYSTSVFYIHYTYIIFAFLLFPFPFSLSFSFPFPCPSLPLFPVLLFPFSLFTSTICTQYSSLFYCVVFTTLCGFNSVWQLGWFLDLKKGSFGFPIRIRRKDFSMQGPDPILYLNNGKNLYVKKCLATFTHNKIHTIVRTNVYKKKNFG